MRIAVIAVCIFLLFLTGTTALLCTWVVTSPFLTNYIARPDSNPFFGSYRILDGFKGVPGFDIRELFNYDRIVLSLLFLITVLKKHGSSAAYRKIDLPFMMFLSALAVSSIYSNNFVHRFRVLVDTFGLCFAGYYIGREWLQDRKRFQWYIKAVVSLGVLLIIVSLSEQYIYRDEFMYRITGPFLYWENLALTLSIILFIAFYARAVLPISAHLQRLLYGLFILLLGLCILLAQTRTVMAATILGMVYIVIKGKEVISRKVVRRYVGMAVLGLAVVAVNPMLLTSSDLYQHRLTKRTDEGRKELYEVAIRIFLQNPLVGIGFRDFVEDKILYITEREYQEEFITEVGNLHNSYLAVACEVGLMGLVPMVLLLWSCFKACRRYYEVSEGREEKMWGLIMAGLTIIYCLSALTFDPFFEPTIDNKLFYICMGVTAGRLQRLECLD
jgi:O-antigen ligase